MYVKMCIVENELIFDKSPSQEFHGHWEKGEIEHHKNLFIGPVVGVLAEISKVPFDGQVYSYEANTPGAPDKRPGMVRLVPMFSNTEPYGEPYEVATEPAPMTHSEFDELNKDELVEKFPTLDISWTRKQMASHLRSKGLLV